MSLRVATGKPIALPPATAPALPPPPGANIKIRTQVVDVWCWAACVQMVLQARGTNKQQCDIASLQLNTTCCTAAGPPTVCKTSIPPAQIAPLWKKLGSTAVVATCGALLPKDLVSELLERPVEVLLGEMRDCDLFLGSGHVVLVVAPLPSQDGQPWFSLRDSNPNSEEEQVSYAGLLSGMSYGHWVASWTRI